MTSASQAEGCNGDILALLAWAKPLNRKHGFSLLLLGRGETGELGGRWRLMAVLTVLRPSLAVVDPWQD